MGILSKSQKMATRPSYAAKTMLFPRPISKKRSGRLPWSVPRNRMADFDFYVEVSSLSRVAEMYAWLRCRGHSVETTRWMLTSWFNEAVAAPAAARALRRHGISAIGHHSPTVCQHHVEPGCPPPSLRSGEETESWRRKAMGIFFLRHSPGWLAEDLYRFRFWRTKHYLRMAMLAGDWISERVSTPSGAGDPDVFKKTWVMQAAEDHLLRQHFGMSEDDDDDDRG